MEHRELSKLKPHPSNPRGVVRVDAGLHELAASIQEQGILQPILITPEGVIIAGHRRARAAKIANLDRVPVIVKQLTETQQLQIMLVENLQRENLTTLQTATAYRQLSESGLSVREIAKAIGFNPQTVTNHLNILELPKELHAAFDGFGLPLGCIKFLLELEPPDQLAVGKLALEKEWLITDIKRAVRQIVRADKQKRKVETGIDPDVLERVWERLQDGCYTPEAVMSCGECGHPLFSLSFEELKRYLQSLVDEGRAEWRKKGGRGEVQRGEMETLCVPRDIPSGDRLNLYSDRNADGDAEDLAA